VTATANSIRCYFTVPVPRQSVFPLGCPFRRTWGHVDSIQTYYDRCVALRKNRPLPPCLPGGSRYAIKLERAKHYGNNGSCKVRTKPSRRRTLHFPTRKHQRNFSAQLNYTDPQVRLALSDERGRTWWSQPGTRTRCATPGFQIAFVGTLRSATPNPSAFGAYMTTNAAITARKLVQGSVH